MSGVPKGQGIVINVSKHPIASVLTEIARKEGISRHMLGQELLVTAVKHRIIVDEAIQAVRMRPATIPSIDVGERTKEVWDFYRKHHQG